MGILEKIPSLFETMHQKSSMCEFLWSDDDSLDAKEVLTSLRLYDLIRRLHYVKTGIEPSPTRILEIINIVKHEKDLYNILMSFCVNGHFPSPSTLRMITNT